MTTFETKDAPEGDILKAFSAYHEQTKEALARLEAKVDEREAELRKLEVKMNRPALGGSHETADLRKAGEALRKYITLGDEHEIKQLSVGNDRDGGYSVLAHFSSELTKRIYETSPFRQLARNVSINSDSFEELLDLEEAEVGWVGEKQARPETDAPTFGKLVIPTHELYANPAVTQKLLDDSSINIGEWLVGKISEKFRRVETEAFFNGDGILKPRGFLTHPTSADDDDSRPWGTVQHVVTGDASGFSAATSSTSPVDCLVDVVTALKADYRTNARWLMNRKTAGTIRKLKDSEGRFIWQDSLQAGQPALMLGYPVTIAEDMPDTTSGNYPVAFGDWRAAYTIVDRMGEKLLRDPYTNKPNVNFYMYRRVGGDVANFEAFKLLKVAAS